MRLLALLALTLGTVSSSRAQLMADTLLTWQGYVQSSECRVQLYRSAEKARRPFTVVLRELEASDGPTTIEDARHLAELVSRMLSVDPEEAFWVFHWGAFSFKRAAPSRKEILLRATFRRTAQGGVGPPLWRVVTREMLEKDTDRHFR